MDKKQLKKNNERGIVPAYELDVEKIQPVGEGIIYISHLGIWLPVEDYIHLRQTGQIV